MRAARAPLARLWRPEVTIFKGEKPLPRFAPPTTASVQEEPVPVASAPPASECTDLASTGAPHGFCGAASAEAKRPKRMARRRRPRASPRGRVACRSRSS